MKNTIFAAFISFLITVTPQLALSAEGSNALHPQKDLVKTEHRPAI